MWTNQGYSLPFFCHCEYVENPCVEKYKKVENFLTI